MKQDISMTQPSSAIGSTSKANISNLLNKLTLSSKFFQRLPSSSYILLLTPFLQVPPPHVSRDDYDMDPFEPFGRTLIEYHRNVRHSPYFAKQGIADIHHRLLKEAGGVIVVVCKPTKTKDVKSEQRVDGLSDQEQFAEEMGKDIRERDIPRLLITIGVDGGTGCDRFDDTLILDDWSHLDHVAARIYEA